MREQEKKSIEQDDEIELLKKKCNEVDEWNEKYNNLSIDDKKIILTEMFLNDDSPYKDIYDSFKTFGNDKF